MTVQIDGSKLTATSPEGAESILPIADFARLVSSCHGDTRGIVLPNGVCASIERGQVVIWIHETTPRIHALRWIDPRSPVEYGAGTRYRTVHVALPYVIVMAVLVPAAGGRRLQLGRSNECFFRVKPLRRLDDELFYPGLLNCSKFASPEGNPLSWICTQYLDWKRLSAETDPENAPRLGLEMLIRCLFETGFNYSSERHEETSWYSESTKADPRISPVERWEKHSLADPLFGLGVKWIPVGLSVLEVAERMFERHPRGASVVRSAADVERLVFVHGRPVKGVPAR